MDRHGEAEHGGMKVLDLLPRSRAVGGAEDAIVVLHPQTVGPGRAEDKAMRILNVGVVLALRGHVCGPHAVGPAVPGGAADGRDPDAATGDADEHTPAVAGIDTDRVDTGEVGAAAEPLLALGMVPE